MTVIETDRLVIRDYTLDDIPVVHHLVQPVEIYQFQPWGPNTEKDTENFVKTAIVQQSDDPRNSYELSVTDKKTGEVIGAIGVRVRSEVTRSGDLGYWIRKDRWGEGFATEATMGILHFGFENLGLNRIWATADPRNTGSLRVLEKAGMKKEGHLRQDIFVRGEFRDSILMAILKDEFSAEQDSRKD